MIDDSSSSRMLFLVDHTKVVFVPTKRFVCPNSVEIGLFKRVLIAVQFLNGIRVGTCQLVGCNSNEAAIFGMKLSLDDVHLTLLDFSPYPDSAKGR